MTADAPTHEELLPLVAAASSVADYGSLRPWRLIEIRGEARDKLGEAFADASDADSKERAKLIEKTHRSSLLLAIVASRKPSSKVTHWEQDATAAGVAHTLSLLLNEAGWGVMWRTGRLVRTKQVRKVHKLADNEELLGWFYIGGIPEKTKPEKKHKFDAERVLSVL